MQRLSPGGYTLIEVLLVLAISTVIFAVSIVVIQGQAAETEFKTSANQLNQKFQQWIDQVQNGLSNSASSASTPTYKCTTTTISGTNYPMLSTASPQERGSNPECIFMGLAFFITNINIAGNLDNNLAYAIPIIGLRTNNQGLPVTTIADAHPIAAITEGAGDAFQSQVDSSVDLSETFTIPNDMRLLWNHNDPSTSGSPCDVPNYSLCSTVGAFFTGLNPSDSGNGAQSIWAVQYPYHQDPSDPHNSSLADCIALRNTTECYPFAGGGVPHFPAPDKNLWPLLWWRICLLSTRDAEWASIKFYSDNGHGINSTIQFGTGGNLQCLAS